MNLPPPATGDRDRPDRTDPGPVDDADRVVGPSPGWAERRRERIAAEIARNRRGEYTVPTWVLVLALLSIVAVWITLIVRG